MEGGIIEIEDDDFMIVSENPQPLAEKKESAKTEQESAPKAEEGK